MSLLRNVASGLRSLFRKEQVDRELDEELRAYREMAAEEKMRDGITRREALRAEAGRVHGSWFVLSVRVLSSSFLVLRSARSPRWQFYVDSYSWL